MRSDGLVCPYSRCRQSFEQPVMVTDHSKLPRETYYACPHCMLRLELLLPSSEWGSEHVHVKTADDCGLMSQLESIHKNRGLGEPVSSAQATRPSKSCRRFLGYLRGLSDRADIPDECAVCPSIVQCYVKRE